MKVHPKVAVSKCHRAPRVAEEAESAKMQYVPEKEEMRPAMALKAVLLGPSQLPDGTPFAPAENVKRFRPLVPSPIHSVFAFSHAAFIAVHVTVLPMGMVPCTEPRMLRLTMPVELMGQDVLPLLLLRRIRPTSSLANPPNPLLESL